MAKKYKSQKSRELGERMKKEINLGIRKLNLPKVPWNKGKGEFLSKEIREKVIAMNLGKKAWNKGKKLGFLPKGAFKKGFTPWNKNKKCPQLSGENHPMYGKHHTKEARIKIGLKSLGKKG